MPMHTAHRASRTRPWRSRGRRRAASLYARLGDLGVTATIAMPWTPTDPAYTELSAKVGAMEAWADAFMI